MKKFITYSIAALALIGCSNDVIIDDAKQDAKDIEIAFETFTDNVTKAENSNAAFSWAFINHHDNFLVWAYKNTSKDPVFEGNMKNDKVSVTGTAAASVFSYAPTRFWDKAATKYEYYAAAPAIENGWTFKTDRISSTDASTQNLGYFETTSTLKDHTLTATVYTESFKTIDATKAIDKMIASPCAVNKVAFGQKVQLNFNHILSRLNVTIKKSDVLEDFDVTMDKLEVINLYGTGDFSESTTAVSTGSYGRWTPTKSADKVNYTAYGDDNENIVVSKDAQYVLQSLVIPQGADFEEVALDGEKRDAVAEVYHSATQDDVDKKLASVLGEKVIDVAEVKAAAKVGASSKPYLKMTYTIQKTHKATAAEAEADSNIEKEGDTVVETTETYTVFYNLANTFGKTGTNADGLAFNEGWQNTLNITIDPLAIEFCANVAEWADYNTAPTGDLDIK